MQKRTDRKYSKHTPNEFVIKLKTQPFGYCVLLGKPRSWVGLIGTVRKAFDVHGYSGDKDILIYRNGELKKQIKITSNESICH